MEGDDTLIGGAGNDIDILTGIEVLVGSAGFDTASYSTATSAVTVSLASTAPQSTGGAGADTLTSIENLTGSDFDDVLTGNGLANVLMGGAGDDVLAGGAGADKFYGGAGLDTVTYANASGAVTAMLASSELLPVFSGTEPYLAYTGFQGAGMRDRAFSNLDSIYGTGASPDAMIYVDLGAPTSIDHIDVAPITAMDTGPFAPPPGTTGPTGPAGLNGAFVEILVGSTWTSLGTITGATEGAYTPFSFEGVSAQFVRLRMSGSFLGVGDFRIFAGGGLAVSDSGYASLSSIENLTGSAFGDTLSGNSGANLIYGLAGDDLIDGGNGADRLDGGAGIDTVSYASAASRVTVSLALATAQDTGGGGTDTLSGFENLTGSAFNDVLTGDDGANILSGGLGNDRLNGGAGIDTASYASATFRVTVNLGVTRSQDTVGAGTDTLVSIENLIGSAFNDTLTGNGGPNRLDGGAGDDILSGGLGDDILDGGEGTDTVTYASANAGVQVAVANKLYTGGGLIDWWQGTVGAGMDLLLNIENLIGSAFDDRLGGDDGANSLTGGDGDDVAGGLGGNDQLFGANGDDVLVGGDGQDKLYGGAGADQLNGDVAGPFDDYSSHDASHNDQLFGGEGDDILRGGDGDDLLDGGLGSDTADYRQHVWMEAGDAFGLTVDLTLTGPQNTGVGFDTLVSIENLVGSQYDDVLTGDDDDNILRGWYGSDTLYGAGGDDELVGGGLSDQLFGGEGDDSLSTGAGASFGSGIWFPFDALLDGGAGSDHLYAGYSDAELFSLSGHASIAMSGGEGDDVIYGGFRNLVIIDPSRIDAHDWSISLDGGVGADQLYGGLLDETLTGGGDDDFIDGGAGVDTAVFSGLRSGYVVSSNGLTVTVTGPDGTDFLTNIEQLKFSDQTVLVADLAPHGTPGDDVLNGGAGDDLLSGGLGDDVLYGGAGFDTADYSDAASGVRVKLGLTRAQDTGQGKDTLVDIEGLIGSAFADSLAGGAGDDHLYGGGGADILNGGAGADHMAGGADGDTYFVDDAGDTVTENADEGADRVNASVSFTLGDNIESLVLTGSADLEGTGNAQANGISGNAGANHLYGLDGADVLSGYGGDDFLYGGAGADNLNGGAGADHMAGGDGNDTYTVDNVLDVVTENANEGSDRVVASVSCTLTDHIETLVLTGSADLDGTGNDQDNTISGNSGVNHLSGMGGDDMLLGAGNSDFLFGGAGGDILKGGGGDDFLVGGAGADRLWGGSGADTFRYEILETSAERDSIADFVSGEDHVDLAIDAFAGLVGFGLGVLDAGELAFGAAATTADQRLIYNQATGILSYDADGVGGATQVQLAAFTGRPMLAASDFILV